MALALALFGCSNPPANMMMQPPADETVTLQSQTFTVPAGEEVFMCQDFANPFGSADQDVQQFESHMTPGSHHLLLFYKDNAVDTPVTPCSGLEFSPTPYGAQTPDATVIYPDGIGTLVKGGQGFHLNMHYLNAKATDLQASVKIVLHKSKAGTVTQHAGLFFFNDVTQILVGPGATRTVSATCTFPKAVNLLYGVAHMHRRSTNMTATLDGKMLYTTDQWDASPLQRFDPAVPAAMGSKLTWSSTIDNTDGTDTITFGESALTNEMSIFDGQYYPADVDKPTIECMR